MSLNHLINECLGVVQDELKKTGPGLESEGAHRSVTKEGSVPRNSRIV